eukprot:TRINITY_DN3274_c0_g1_i1.p1 TRINITY_DN3274_c0_g1~~TRINITY_DN3274_c0_g1_i1.p1  ORF type:complete len:413 (+),score=83.91 TRINITY_DN3274_c0_g1_i1:437-1675(+)
MQHLYSASVVRPLSAAGTVANRLGYSLLSWSESDDLVAVISGDGSVHIFHADAPAETTMLLAYKRAPARHVAWRPRRDKPPLLLVADASSRLTIWMAKDRRTNVWFAVEHMPLHSAVLSVGWSKGGCSIMSVLASGALHVLRVDEELGAVQAPGGGSPRLRRPVGWTPISDKDPSLLRVFGGSLRCGSVAAGGVSDGSVAVVTVSTADPRRICVWHVFLDRSGKVDVRPLGAVRLAEEDGRCIACLTAPSAGTLFAWSDRGSVSRWYYSRSPAAGRGGAGREGGGGAATVGPGPGSGGSGRVGGSADGMSGPGGHGRGGGTDGGVAGRAGASNGGGGDGGRSGSGDSAAGRPGGAAAAVADHGKGNSNGNSTANGGGGEGLGRTATALGVLGPVRPMVEMQTGRVAGGRKRR